MPQHTQPPFPPGCAPQHPPRFLGVERHAATQSMAGSQCLPRQYRAWDESMHSLAGGVHSGTSSCTSGSGASGQPSSSDQHPSTSSIKKTTKQRIDFTSACIDVAALLMFNAEYRPYDTGVVCTASAETVARGLRWSVGVPTVGRYRTDDSSVYRLPRPEFGGGGTQVPLPAFAGQAWGKRWGKRWGLAGSARRRTDRSRAEHAHPWDCCTWSRDYGVSDVPEGAGGSPLPRNLV